MACNPLIDDPFDFPRRARNRPALPHIGCAGTCLPKFPEGC